MTFTRIAIEITDVKTNYLIAWLGFIDSSLLRSSFGT